MWQGVQSAAAVSECGNEKYQEIERVFAVCGGKTNNTLKFIKNKVLKNKYSKLERS